MQHKENGDTWYSVPFYSSFQGYKMRLIVDANGDGDAAGTHVSTYVQIIRGEYDDMLAWPYRGAVTYLIINWTADRYHIKHTADFSKKDARGCGNKPAADRENISYGNPRSLHQYCYNDKEYISNNILYIKVMSITE